MSDNPFESEDFKVYANHVVTTLVPKLSESFMTISLAPTDPVGDVKFAVELGFSIMMNKPIIVVARPGQEISPALVRVAHKVVRVDMEAAGAQDTIAGVISELVAEFDLDHR